MNKQKKLLLGRNIFIFIIFIAFGVIITTEKAGQILIPKAQKKFDNYIDKNFKEIKDSFKFNKIKYKNRTFTMKIQNKNNKNHYFYITYHNKKIKDTYKEDYLKGKTLFKYLEKKLQKEIQKETNTACTIKINESLDKHTNIVQEKIINEDNLLELKFYTIEKEILINNWDKKTITDKIIDNIKIYNSKNITPKNYNITITDKNDITKSIEITNINENFITNTSNEEIINDIINDNNSKVLKENKIKYKYLN